MRKSKKKPLAVKKKRNAKNSTLEELIDWVDETPTSGDEDGAPVIWVHDFTEDSAREFARTLRKFEENKQVNTIIVRIDSYGGEIYSLFSMLEALEACEKNVYTVCSGKAMSAGAILLSAGDRRFMGKYSTVMVHQANGGTDGSTADVSTDAKELERLQDIFLSILAKNCGTNKQSLKNLIKENSGADIFFTAKQALEFGLVDYIGVPKLRKSTRWEVIDAAEEEDEE